MKHDFRHWRGGAAGIWTALAVAGLGIGLIAVSSATAARQPVRVQHVALVVKSDSEHARKGPDGKWHDALLPASFKVRAGEQVVVTVYNYDSGPHSFAVPGLHINTILMGGSATAPHKTTFTFTAHKRGVYAWHCDPKCDPWAMKHDGFMRGKITVA